MAESKRPKLEIPHQMAWHALQAIYATALEMGDGEFFAHIGLEVDASLADFLFHYQISPMEAKEGTDIDFWRLMADLESHAPTKEAFARIVKEVSGSTVESFLSGLIEYREAAEKAGDAEAVQTFQAMIDDVLAGGKLKRQ